MSTTDATPGETPRAARPRPETAATLDEARVRGEQRRMERFRFVITRPVAVTMVFLATLVFGWFSLQLLPVNLMPEISYPQLTVRAEYAGAAPAEVENDVARPLEEALGVVTGVTRISSISTAGYCDVVLEFAWGTDMDEANQDVLEKLDIVDPLLPDDVKQPLILRYDPNLDPVLVLSLSGEGAAFEGIAGLKQLRRIADRDIKRLIEPLDGVAAVKVKGGLEEEVLVELDEDALRRTNVALSAISQRLAAENINLAGGTMREGTTRYLVRTVNEFRDLDDIANTVVLSREGREVRLRDVAKVSSGYKDREVVTRVDGAEAVQVEIYKEADANIVDMATRVRQRLDGAGGRGSPPGLVERMQREYGVRLDVVSDRSLFINSSIQEVLSTALFGGLLAVLVLFLFLRDLKPTLIVGLSIPVSVIVTFAPLKLAGVSLNVMSLGGLALGIGMLVDNSIVVLESIQRCVDEGDTPLRAVVRGTSEVGSAVISSTLTTVAVFFPMVFVEGVAGQMFGDLGLTIVFSLLASLAVAMSLIPMLSARSFKPEVVEGRFITALVQHWTAWGSVSELVASAKAARWWTWLLVLPALWRLVRFALHLAFELVGKLVWTLFVIVARVVLAVGLVGFRIIGVAVSPVLAGFSAGIDVLGAAYRYVIRASLRGAVVVYLLVVGAGASLVILAPQLDTELIPEMHQGEFTVEMKFPVGTPLGANEAVLAPLERELREEIPRLRATVATLGTEKDDTEAGEKGEHVAKLAVALYAGGGQVEAARRRSASGAPASGAPASGAPAARDGSTAGDGIQATGSETDAVPSLPAVTTELAEEEAFAVVRRVLDGVPDLDYTLSRPALFSFKTPVEVEVRGYELEDLAKATALVAEAIEHVPGLRDIESSIQPGSPEIQIIYDRDALTKLGLDIRVVAELVRDKVQGYEATKFNRRDRKIPVRVRLAEIREAGVEELRQLVVNPGGARPIPLEAVADVRLGRGPNEIRRISQQRVGLVTASVEGIGLGSASERIREAVDALELPEGTSAVITGQSEEWETSSRSLWIALALSVFLVYVIMASQFENLVQPLVILFTIPLALVGVVVVLWVIDMPVSVVVLLGVIMLAGIVVNNAIVLVDYVNQLRSRGIALEEAIETAGEVRLRPILMTTLTTVLGLMPMALGLGDGAEIRQPMAITVIAGLSMSTLLTLVVIPTVYYGVERLIGRSTEVNRDLQLTAEIMAVDPRALGSEFDELAESAAHRGEAPGGADAVGADADGGDAGRSPVDEPPRPTTEAAAEAPAGPSPERTPKPSPEADA